jgi:hypothetical protein
MANAIYGTGLYGTDLYAVEPPPSTTTAPHSASSRTRPLFVLVFGGPLTSPTELPAFLPGRDRLNAREIGTVYTNQAVGGHGRVSIEFEPGEPVERWSAPAGNRLPQFGHLAVRVGLRTVWEGRYTSGRFGPDGDYASIEGEGYLVAAGGDDWFRGGDEGQLSAGRILLRAVRQYAMLSPGVATQWIDPGTLHSRRELARQTIGALVEAVAAEGGRGASDWFAVAYDRRVQLLPRVTPARPTYMFPDDGTVEIEELGDGVGAVTVVWQDADDNEHEITRENPFFGSANGVSVHRRLDGSFPSATAATRFAETYLRLHAKRRYAVTVRRGFDDWLELTTGGRRPPWLAHSGTEWAQIRGLPALPVIQVRVDVREELVELTLGDASPETLATLLLEGQRAAEDLSAKRDPLTKQRLN